MFAPATAILGIIPTFDTVDALLVPSTLGIAPATLASTGDPVMNKLWTLTGNPCVNVPGLVDPGGMPLGLTVLTRFGRDREALAIAARLETLIAESMEAKPRDCTFAQKASSESRSPR